MSHFSFSFCGETLYALASGALFWPEQHLLCVSDLHFGKAQRYALQGASALPPYEVHETLSRLEADITSYQPKTVICLGDSFDRLAASDDLDPQAREWINQLQDGIDWIWIEGNHDPGPVGLRGTHALEVRKGAIVFRHIAIDSTNEQGEISGHYHPKATLRVKKRAITRRCFVTDNARVVVPAYGTYTGGLSVHAEPLASLFDAKAMCIFIGSQALPVLRSDLI